MGGKRNYRFIASTKPTTNMWKEQLRKPTAEGGCNAVDIDIKEEIQKMEQAAEVEEGETKSFEEYKAAIVDRTNMKQVSWNLSVGKSCPDWTLPNELVRTMFFPRWLSRKRARRG